MRHKASPALIGGFIVSGLAVLSVVIVTVAGKQLFVKKEHAVMHFSGSVYGLQVGAPVVFRGVRVGSVTNIEVVYDRATDKFSIPVVAELDGNAVRGMGGRHAQSGLVLPTLVQRGLNAQLSMQSILTGLLYVDLDLRPEAASSLRQPAGDLVEIPTTATAIQALKAQLDGMDFGGLVQDLSAIAASARAVVAGPELQQALRDLARITASMKQLSERLDKRVDPLADDLQRTLASTRSAVQALGTAAQSVDSNARRLGAAGDNAAALLAPDSALVQQLQRAADAVAQSALSLRQATAADAPLVRGGEQALQDVSRAARALRDLAETLEQQPEALLRGRGAAK